METAGTCTNILEIKLQLGISFQKTILQIIADFSWGIGQFIELRSWPRWPVFNLKIETQSWGRMAIKKSLITFKDSSFLWCGASWIRTSDTRIFSPLLYQLSYGTLKLLFLKSVAFSDLWCQLGSNQRHKDFQSFALPTELWHLQRQAS